MICAHSAASFNGGTVGNVPPTASQNFSSMQQCASTPKFSLNLSDIEESIRSFDGNGNLPVNVWLEELEETALCIGMIS